MSLSEISVKIKDFLLPKYTEITLFLTSLSAFLIFIAVKEFREGAINFFIKLGDPLMWLLAIFILTGFLSSVYYSFTYNKISNFYKECMLIYVVLVNVTVGLYAGLFLTEKSSGINEIFPTINFLNALFLLAILRKDISASSIILDIHAKRSEILFGSIAVIIIFIYSRYILNDYWALTFSMCLAYATTINEIINKILFRDKTDVVLKN